MSNSSSSGGGPTTIMPQSGSSSSGSSGSHHVSRVILRNYSKGLFFYPLVIYSLIAMIIELVRLNTMGADYKAHAAVGVIWIAIFFANIFVVSFDFSTGKFLTLVLAIVAIILIIALVTVNGQAPPIDMPTNEQLATTIQPGMTYQFYLFAFIATGIIFLFTLLEGQFKYVKIETNEVYVKGLLGDAKRFPTSSLRISEKIDDIFEYMAARAGSVTLEFTGEKNPLHLETVPFFNKKKVQIDELLSTTRVTHG